MTSYAGRFAGKVAIVTGAAQGIGRTVALRIAREGGSLALIDRAPLVEEPADPSSRPSTRRHHNPRAGTPSLRAAGW